MTAAHQTYLYPRLPRSAGRTLLAEFAALEPADLRARASLTHPEAAPAATGGTPVPLAVLFKVQQEIRSISDGFGFPAPLNLARQQDLDRKCATRLVEVMGIVPADAAEEGVWSFLSLLVVPEFSTWRFPGRSEERLIGKPRNALRRLWWRAWTLGPDLEWAPEGCSPFQEDEYVQMMERTSLSGNRRTIRAFQDAVWRAEKAGIPMARNDAIRDLITRLRAVRSYLCLDALPDQDLSYLLDELLDQMLEANGHFSRQTQG